MKRVFSPKALVLLLVMSSSFSEAPKMLVASNRQVSSTKREYLILPEDEYLKLKEDQIDIAVGSLIIAKGMYPDIDIRKYLNQIDTMAKELESKVKSCKNPRETIKAINRYLFVRQKLKYNQDKYFINNVLDEKSGHCVSLSCLYLSIAERLHLPFYGVLADEHMFVRYDDGSIRVNVETQTGGDIRTEEQVLAYLSISSSVEAAQGRGYLRNLTKRQSLSQCLAARGKAYADKEDIDRAIEDYSRAIGLDPQFAIAYNNRGGLFEMKGDHVKAIRDCTKAISIDPKHVTAYYNRGNSLAAKGDFDEAIQDYTAAISIDPKYANAYYNRGLAYEEKGDIDKAIEDYSKTKDLNPKLAVAYLSRGDAFSRRRDFDKAIQDYTKAISVDPKNAKAYHNRGSEYFNKGDIDNAIEDYTKAIGLDPKLETAYYNRGRGFASKSKYDLALSDFSRAIAINSKVADYFFYRATVYVFKEDKENAFQDFTRAIELDPGYMNKVKDFFGRFK
jgi:tetratricopeptide (TPR) repeat protein